MSSTSSYTPARKRQWGAERRTEPLPTVHPKPSDRKITWSRVAIVATIVFWAIYVVTTIIRQFLVLGTQDFRFTMEAIGYTVGWDDARRLILVSSGELALADAEKDLVVGQLMD